MAELAGLTDELGIGKGKKELLQTLLQTLLGLGQWGSQSSLSQGGAFPLLSCPGLYRTRYLSGMWLQGRVLGAPAQH